VAFLGLGLQLLSLRPAAGARLAAPARSGRWSEVGFGNDRGLHFDEGCGDEEDVEAAAGAGFVQRLASERDGVAGRDLLPVGGRIEYKTDQQWLFDWSLEQFEAMGFALSEITHDLHQNGPFGIMTNYEARFCEAGTPICRCVAHKTEDRPAVLPEPEKKPSEA